jgi:hypothetical protein
MGTTTIAKEGSLRARTPKNKRRRRKREDFYIAMAEEEYLVV